MSKKSNAASTTAKADDADQVVLYKVERAGQQTHAVTFGEGAHRASVLDGYAARGLIVKETPDGSGAMGYLPMTVTVTEAERLPGDKVLETIQPKPKKAEPKADDAPAEAAE